MLVGVIEVSMGLEQECKSQAIVFHILLNWSLTWSFDKAEREEMFKFTVLPNWSTWVTKCGYKHNLVGGC